MEKEFSPEKVIPITLTPDNTLTRNFFFSMIFLQIFWLRILFIVIDRAVIQVKEYVFSAYESSELLQKSNPWLELRGAI